jgi:hypothetical protein
MLFLENATARGEAFSWERAITEWRILESLNLVGLQAIWEHKKTDFCMEDCSRMSHFDSME